MKTDPAIIVIAILAILGSIAVLAPWIGNFHGLPIAQQPKDWADFGSYVGGTLAPILAFASLMGLLATVHYQARSLHDVNLRADSVTYQENATKSLERAFQTFVGNSENMTPISDRLVWLTTARLILSAKSMAQKISVNSIREIYDANEEFWRKQFYDLLQPMNSNSPLADPNYFRQGEQKIRGYAIDERSIRVIYEFIEWPKELDDPIMGIQRFSDTELENMNLGRHGVKEYVESLRRQA